MKSKIASFVVGLVVLFAANAADAQGFWPRVSTTSQAPVNTGLPAISPAPGQTGDTFTVTSGVWNASPAPTFSYQWQCSGSDIVGATASSYVAGAACPSLTTIVGAANGVLPNGSATSNSVVVSSPSSCPWCVAGSSLDIDYVNDRADRLGVSSTATGVTGVTFTRASQATSSSLNSTAANPTFTRSTFAVNTQRRTSLGSLVETAATANLFVNPTVPATQSFAVSAVSHVAMIQGSGSLTLSGAATGVVTEGHPLIFTPSAGTLTTTVAGTVRIANVWQGTQPSSYRTFAGVRADDNWTQTIPNAPSEATVSFDLVAPASGTYGEIDLYNNAFADGYAVVFRDTDNLMKLQVEDSGGSTFCNAGPDFQNRTGNVTVVWKTLAVSFYVNGVKICDVTNRALPPLDTIYFGGTGASWESYVQRATVVPSALTQAAILGNGTDANPGLWPEKNYRLPTTMAHIATLVDPIVLDLGLTPANETNCAWVNASQTLNCGVGRQPASAQFPDDRDVVVIPARDQVKTVAQVAGGGRRTHWMGGEQAGLYSLDYAGSCLLEGFVFSGVHASLNITNGDLQNDGYHCAFRRQARNQVTNTYEYTWRGRQQNDGGYAAHLHGDCHQAQGSRGGFAEWAAIELFSCENHWGGNGIYNAAQVAGLTNSPPSGTISKTITPGAGTLQICGLTGTQLFQRPDTVTFSTAEMVGIISVRLTNWTAGVVGGVNPVNNWYYLQSYTSDCITLTVAGASATGAVTGAMTINYYYGPYYAQTPRYSEFRMKDTYVQQGIHTALINYDGSGNPQCSLTGCGTSVYPPLDYFCGSAPGVADINNLNGGAQGGCMTFPQVYESGVYGQGFQGTSDPDFITRLEPVGVAAVTGTISTTSGSGAIVGTGTAFTTALKTGYANCNLGPVGMYVKINGAYYVTTAVTDNTHITVTPNLPSTLGGQTIQLVTYDWRCYAAVTTPQISFTNANNSWTGTKMYPDYDTSNPLCTTASYNAKPELQLTGTINFCAPPEDFVPYYTDGGGLGRAGRLYISPRQTVQY